MVAAVADGCRRPMTTQHMGGRMSHRFTAARRSAGNFPHPLTFTRRMQVRPRSAGDHALGEWWFDHLASERIHEAQAASAAQLILPELPQDLRGLSRSAPVQKYRSALNFVVGSTATSMRHDVCAKRH